MNAFFVKKKRESMRENLKAKNVFQGSVAQIENIVEEKDNGLKKRKNPTVKYLLIFCNKSGTYNHFSR